MFWQQRIIAEYVILCAVHVEGKQALGSSQQFLLPYSSGTDCEICQKWLKIKELKVLLIKILHILMCSAEFRTGLS